MLICAVANWVTSKVAALPAIAPVVVEAMTELFDEVALAAAQVLAFLTASAAAWKAVSLVLIDW